MNYFQLLLKCEMVKSEIREVDKMFAIQSGLPYYVLQSLQGRLSVLGGYLNVSLKPGNKLDILIQLIL